MCLSPYTYRDKITKELKQSPCQKCQECRYLFSRHMSDRIRAECQNHGYTAYFITYTIAPEYYVITPNELHEYIVKMHKLIRKENPIKFVYSIELGDRTGRLHWHEILLINYKDIISVYNFIIQYWDKGFIEIEKATLIKIHYVVSYLYDGVYKRAFSKGIGKLTDTELVKYCENHQYCEIPTYYRKQLKDKYPLKHNELLLKWLYSNKYEQMRNNTKDIKFRDKKVDKLEQFRYASSRYKIADGKEVTIL